MFSLGLGALPAVSGGPWVAPPPPGALPGGWQVVGPARRQLGRAMSLPSDRAPACVCAVSCRLLACSPPAPAPQGTLVTCSWGGGGGGQARPPGICGGGGGGQARARGSCGTAVDSGSEGTALRLRMIYEDSSGSLTAAPSGLSGRFWPFYFLSKSPDCPSP